MSNYYQLRSEVAKAIPRYRPLISIRKAVKPIKEKGRKTGYSEFKLDGRGWVPQERLLNTETVNSFVEVSCRAQACPMPLNVDVWDGLRCPFGCKYCFADSFRASLYTAFFDNSKQMGLRHCDPNYYKREFDKLMVHRGKDPHGIKSDVGRAVAMEIPMRFGIRFEDFPQAEAETGISLELLRYLADVGYPVMLNTKSALVGTPPYVEALARNRSAVHMTLISSNNAILKALEPGAPSYEQRIGAMQSLVDGGVRVVARIEPFLVFLCDQPEDVQRYQLDLKTAGVRHITFDTYSYTGKNPGIRQAFRNAGYDWDRLFLAGCDSQGLGSLLLGEFMKLWREAGFSCSTFDMGNVSDNDQDICCEVGDYFGTGFNYGCTVMAGRYIKSKGGEPTSWTDFRGYVRLHGGFLSENLEMDVHRLWNAEGADAYSHAWTAGLRPVGSDREGLLWIYDAEDDFRRELI